MIYVVTGANYGDEGKGNIVSYLSNKQKNSIVIRHNGGAQAQHRVVRGNDSFIFGHIGSGSFDGLPTYLSKFFISNPLILKKEMQSFQEIAGNKPEIYINSESRVTTIYDMLYNQLHSETRKNGTCGLGVRATIERNEVIPLSVFDVLRNKNMPEMIKIIKDYYYRKLLSENCSEKILSERLMSIDHLSHAHELNELLGTLINKMLISDHEPKFLHTWENNLIFEGSQGLSINQDNFDEFPNVTPSTVGIRNAERIISGLTNREGSVEYVYVTRTYLTRHGNGRFNETKVPVTIDDVSNKNNEFQGMFKYALMTPQDAKDIYARIDKDLEKSIITNSSVATIALTHVDQYQNELLQTHAKYISMGPSYRDVFERSYNYRGLR